MSPIANIMIYIILLLVVTGLFGQIIPEILFGGDGLTIYQHTILHNRILEINCTTYDDCYQLLYDLNYEPIFFSKIVPFTWNGLCDQLNNTDNRLLQSEIDVYYYHNIYKTFYANTCSENSILLCKLAKDKTVKRIYYYSA